MRNFAKQYAAAVTVVESRSTIPCLTSVLIDAKKKTMLFTDMDIAVTLQEVPVTGAGEILINAHVLANIIKKPGFKSLVVKKDILTVQSDYDYTLKSTIPAEDFPQVQLKGDWQVIGKFNSGIFTSVSYAASTEATRYYLNGIYVHQENGILKTCATDGHRLALHNSDIQVNQFEGMIVPNKTTHLVPKLMDNFVMEFVDNKLVFTEDNVRIVSKLVDGTFPDYHRVVPDYKKDTFSSLKIDWEKLGQFAKDNKASDTNRGVSFLPKPLDKSITFETKIHPDAHVTFSLKNTGEGNLPDIGFNIKYVAELIANLGCACNTVGYFSDGFSPAVFISGAELHVLIPMRV